VSTDIVQMGRGACRPIAGGGCNNLMHDGWAWGRSPSSPGCGGHSLKIPTATWFGSISPGGTYSVVQEADGDFVTSSTNHGAWISTNSICWTNSTVAVFVESHDFGDALGGSAANSYNFTSKQFKTSAAGAWMVLPNQCNVGGGLPPIFHCFADAEGRLRLWTDR
jgi:hypothetical protein